MKRCLLLLSCLLLTACANVPTRSEVPTELFSDSSFTPPAQPVQAGQIFALSPEMKAYIDTELSRQIRSKGLKQGLLEALYRKNQLKLEYDSEHTRNATEAFEARSGNCLSLVIMTGAIANHLGMQVTYQSVYTDDIWTRANDIYFASGHVNLTLGHRLTEPGVHGGMTAGLTTWTIDFLPPEELRGQRSREVSESTVAAMYMNNRAAESLAEGDLDTAYAWARAAVSHQPGYLSAYNTLGVIYLRHGLASQAEKVFAHVLQRDPTSTMAMSNLARVLEVQGRTEESAALTRALTRLDPEPPYYFFDLGRAAMRRGDYADAKAWFQKEVKRAPYNHEFHFWLAQAQAQLGDMRAARSQLDLALSTSTTRRNQQLYAAKLDRLKQLGVQ
ncbi:MAG TPA: tetratricopeptide repeat protein [Rhizobacter sp.]|nr:tetratricopeptide repeat protein [Rhizobacter sp.]